jgi:hypothetical protein
MSEKKFYLLQVMGGVEPRIHGPYPDERTQEKAARVIHEDMGEDDVLFWLDLHGDNPQAGSFTAAFFDNQLRMFGG